MKAFDCLIANPEGLGLSAFANQTAGLLGIFDSQERESSHDIEGFYLCGTHQGHSLKIMLHGAVDHADRPFWLRIKMEDEPAIHEFIRENFCSHGLKVCLIKDFGQISESRMDFY